MKRLQVFLALLVILAMLLPACQPAVNNNLEVPSVSSGTEGTESSSEPPTDGTTIPSVPGSTPSSEPATEPENTQSSEAATNPSAEPSEDPSESSSAAPTEEPTVAPTETPTVAPTVAPTEAPTEAPTTKPTERPTEPTEPSVPPTTQPSQNKGSGTKNDPFLITCLEDLLNLKNVLNKSGYYYKQTADIDCSSVGNWITIGDDSHPFRHHYDGGGYTISNLCLDGDAQALFSWVEGSHFKNMKIVNAHTKDNHRTQENRTDKQPGGGASTGAIVGYGSGCSFENCTATVNFLSSNSCTGGLIGGVELKNEQYTLMKNCHVSGTITSGGYTGGLIGSISTSLSDGDYKPAETITIEDCSADVEIIIFTTSIETPCVGGLIGKSFGVLVEKCHTTGKIDVIEGDIGGLIGQAGNYTDVTRCYSTVDIYASSDDHYGGVSIGGLIGHIYSRSDVYDCYATGDITAPYVEWSPCQDDTNINGGPWRKYYNPCGSLIGTLTVFEAYSEDQKITVYNCYATGKVNVPNICEDKRVYCHGALIGLVLDRETVTRYNIKDTTKKDLTSWDDFKEYYIGHFGNNYNLEDLRTYYEPINDYQYTGVSGLQNPKYKTLPTHEYVEIITETQLTDQSTFEGWDFVNVWKLTANGPVLR